MLFTHGVFHHNLVVHLDAIILWMDATNIDWRIEEDHEVRCYLVNVTWILRHHCDIIWDRHWNWSQVVIDPILWCHFILDFIVQIVQTLRISLVSSPVDHYHWKLDSGSLLSILPVLEYSWALAKLAVDCDQVLLASRVCTFDLYIIKNTLEEQISNSELTIVTSDFHEYYLLRGSIREDGFNTIRALATLQLG